MLTLSREALDLAGSGAPSHSPGVQLPSRSHRLGAGVHLGSISHQGKETLKSPKVRRPKLFCLHTPSDELKPGQRHVQEAEWAHFPPRSSLEGSLFFRHVHALPWIWALRAEGRDLGQTQGCDHGRMFLFL